MTFNVFGLLKIYGNHFSYMAWADHRNVPTRRERGGWKSCTNPENVRVVPTGEMLLN